MTNGNSDSDVTERNIGAPTEGVKRRPDLTSVTGIAASAGGAR
jgi:hypothetical protein